MRIPEADVRELTAADWSIALGELGAVVTDLDAIRQSLRILLATSKGADYFRPDFGVDLPSYLDRPIGEVVAELRPEIVDQVALYEPRAEVVGVSVAVGTVPGSLVLRLTWRPTGAEVPEESFGETFTVYPDGKIVVQEVVGGVVQNFVYVLAQVGGGPETGVNGGTVP